MPAARESVDVTSVGGADATAPHYTVVDAWRAAVAEAADRPQLRYRTQAFTRAEVTARAQRVALQWQLKGLLPGDRVAVQLQNVPAMVDVVLGAWLSGLVVVPLNPMYRQRELGHVLGDSGAALLVHDGDVHNDAEAVARGAGVRHVVPVAALDEAISRPVVAEPSTVTVTPADLALLTYTSGTTGPPKGAAATHANVAAGAEVYRAHAGVESGSVILATAPLCHVTGMIGHLAASLYSPAELVLMGRFDAGTALDLIERHRVTFTIGALTAFRSLLTAVEERPRDLGSVRSLYSGGAPVAPAVAHEVERVFGVPLGNAYGLTETTSISHLTPVGERARVDGTSGALSVGRPVAGTRAWVIDEDGARLGPGRAGELVIEGPGVVAGYWHNDDATSATFVGDALRTGDVAVIDADGWTYLVDRKKDQINASGFKVWPREVEDVLYEHPAVDQAAVYGVPDEYRGESVAAAVVLRRGAETDPVDLIAFTRARLASYKCPRQIRVVSELPTTSSGKIMRRELRRAEDGAEGRGGGLRSAPRAES